MHVGDLRAARDHYRAAVAIARRLEPHNVSALLGLLADVVIEEGGLEEATGLLDQARDRIVGSDQITAYNLARPTVEMARCRGDAGRALEILTGDESIQADLASNPTDRPAIALRTGALHLDLGRRDEALLHLRDAERLAREASDWRFGVLLQAYLALAGDRDPASVVLPESAPVSCGAETHLVLHRAGAAGDHLARARELCEHLSRHLEGEKLADFWRWNPTARGVLEEERRRSGDCDPPRGRG